MRLRGIGPEVLLLCFLVVGAAAFALFYPQLDAWADPVAPNAEGRMPALQPVFEQLLREQRGLERASIGFSIHEHTLSAEIRGAGEHREFRYSAQTGRLEPRASKLGSFLYQLHYLGPLPCGMYLAGLASMALCLSLATGLLIHLKDLVRQWFQFRPERGLRTWLSDMHKVLGVLGLPFQLLYAWSGAVLCLGWVTIVPVFERAVFDGNAVAALVVRGERPLPAANRPASHALHNLDDLMNQARAAVPRLEPNYLWLEHPGGDAARATVYGRVPGVPFGNAQVVLDAHDGQLLRVSDPHRANSLQRFEAWLFGLHYAQFGGSGVKWLYAVLALGTCAVIVTGNWVWLERRDRGRRQLGNRILQRLTVGACAGFPLAVSALFAANRALPATLVQRSMLEQAVFWTAFAGALLWPFLVRADRKVLVQELLLSASLFLLAFGLDVAQRPLRAANATQRGVDICLFCLALGCGSLGLRGARVWPSKRLVGEPAGSGQ